MKADEKVADLARRAAAQITATNLRTLAIDVQAFRYSRRLTLVDVAAETGLSRSTIWRIEKGGDVRLICIMAILDWMGSRE